MADIVLAECSGQAWLVRGEQHIDDLLGNTLKADVTIEVVPCESKLAVDALWHRWNEASTAHMWMIHPAILGRVRGRPAGSTVVFAPWSAQIDAAAQRVIDGVARAAEERPDTLVALVRSEPGGGTAEAAMGADLANLRLALLESRLTAAGVAATRLVREVRAAEAPDDAEHIVLLLR